MKRHLLATCLLLAPAFPAAACATYEQQLAHNHVKQYVKARLKSPRNANFPFQPTQKVLSTAAGGCTVTLAAWVEAPNSLGVAIRNNYVAEVVIRDKQVTIEAFSFID